MVADPEGKSSVTKIRPLFVNNINNRTLVLCRPLTGRQHQIRAHLSLIGYPIVADKLYHHGDAFFDGLSKGHTHLLQELAHHRHALHAARLSLKINQQNYIFKCPLPDDFTDLLGMKK